MAPSKKQLKVLVTGPTGTTGRATVKELLDRGHIVSGLSRNPEKWGQHENYRPVKGSQLNDLEGLTKIVEGHDVVISAFAPSHSAELMTYCGLVEGAWRIKEATKKSATKPYLIYVGGAGSLLDPKSGKVCLDQPEATWSTYLFHGPIEHLAWLRNVIKMPLFHVYYYVRELGHSNSFGSSIARLYTNFFEKSMLSFLSNPESLTMPHACRSALYYFEDDETFDWSFLSPPWFYRDGPRTGEYGTTKDYQPADEAGRFLGISNADIAVALADEAEEQKKKWVHWSAYARQKETDNYYNNYRDLKFKRFEHDG
ncbi:hypothetical protein AbraIFM66951_011483 [Aspergillus brasiliensis]|nr:hypothetical protein AbraIFM66951_011483 [Aspergillus brasiliensis]